MNPYSFTIKKNTDIRSILRAGFAGVLVIVQLIGYPAGFVHAQTTASAANPETLRSQIDTTAQQIADLEAEMRRLQGTLDVVNNQGQSLERDIKQAQISVQQLATKQRLLEAEIRGLGLAIDQESETIVRLEQSMGSHRTAVAELMQRTYEAEREQNMLWFVLGSDTLAELAGDIDSGIRIRESFRDSVVQLGQTRDAATAAREQLEKKRVELDRTKKELVDQKRILDAAQAERKKLLNTNKAQAAQYQAQIAERARQRAALDAEIRTYESQLAFILDPKQIPLSGSQVLGWPLASVYITQRFGKTVDSRRLYTSGSHSGVDFRAAVGTPVYAVADGVVEGVGDTDATCPKTSFGKWVFIRHPNGLATAYGHLSLIKAVSGQQVRRGDLIAYSGATGHVTGPHLHLTVYASHGLNGEDGAGVKTRPSTTCPGRTYTMPLAPTSAYLDPMLYLPAASQSMFKN